ncbi:MAG: hypothetical protein EWM73_00188 [Nitrospira sp.]|nr:MAG: hypothetical protein EWM73_00188 [Nitrospira sp.]
MAGGNGHARVPFLAQDRKADSRLRIPTHPGH